MSIVEMNWVRSASPVIATWLSDADDTVASRAALALNNLDARDAASAFERLLEHSSAKRRCLAAKALGNLGGPSAPLIARLRDSSEDVREAAASALGRLRAAEATPDLLSLTWNSEGGRLDEVFAALGKIADSRAVPDLLRHADGKRAYLRGAATGTLASMRLPEALPRVSTLLTDPEPNLRIQALVMLSTMKIREAVPQIEARLSDSDGAVRGWAAKALAITRAWDKAEAIARLLQDPESYVRGIAAECLGDLGARPYAERIMKLLRDETAGTRSRAIRALGALGASDYLQKIRSFLESEEPDLRVSAIRALIQLRAKNLWPEIVGHIGDPEWEVRQVIAAAGEDLTDNTELSRLTLLFGDPHPLVRWGAATACVHRGNRDGVPLLLKEYRDRRWPIPSEAGPVYQGKTLRSLNALREPELYHRLRQTPMDLASASSRREFIAKLTERFDRTVEWSEGTDDATFATRWEWDGGMRPSVLDGLTALLQGTCEEARSPRFEFILERDRIKILSGYEALLSWEDWVGLTSP